MGFAERGEAHREAWRSLSRRENAEIIFLPHYQSTKQKLFAVICSLLHFVEVPRILVLPLHQKRGINTPPSSSAKELANIGPDILSAAKSLTLG